ncbi:Imm70 family immunity protein [Achromobacter pestifer]
MGLYLCVFDGDEELEGVEVGLYEDFNCFRDAVLTVLENNIPGSVCPTLQGHLDCDGEWTPQEANSLLGELKLIEQEFAEHPPIEFNSDWKKGVAKLYSIAPVTMLDCFFDIDGEPLVGRLRQLALVSVNSVQPIVFQ